MQLVRVANFNHGEHIAAHEPAFQRQLLQAVEVVQPHGIAAATVLCPKPELCLGLGLPFFSCLRGKPQHIPVNSSFQGQASADHLCAVGVDGTRGNRCAHVEHPAALPQGVGVVVYIAARRVAVGEECPQRAPLVGCARFAVSAGLRCSSDAVSDAQK